MQAVALPAREVLDEFLLVRALEVEASDVGPRRYLVIADAHDIQAVGYLLPHRFTAVQIVPGLIHVGYLYGFTHFDLTTVGGLMAHQHLEQGGLAHAIGANDADDAALGYGKADAVEQQSVAKGFA